MNRERGMRAVIILFMISGLYALISDLLVVSGKSTPAEPQSAVFVFSILALVLAGSIIKNKYWILAFVFDGLHTVVQFIASRYTVALDVTFRLSSQSFMAVIVGVLCTLLSLVCFYKLFLIPDLVSRKHAYAWMLALDDYIKKKFHR